MNTLQILLILLIAIIVMLIFQKSVMKPKIIKKYFIDQQHPIYPFVQYDIREILPPSRRTYMRYPYYATRSGILIR